jgi:beta-glucosidase
VAGTDFRRLDRGRRPHDLDLPGAQASMISQVEAANPNTVVYLETVGQVDLARSRAPRRRCCGAPTTGSGRAPRWPTSCSARSTRAGTCRSPGTTTTASCRRSPTTPSGRPRPTLGRTYQYFTGKADYPFGYGSELHDVPLLNITVNQSSLTANQTLRVKAG